jgi:predicted RNase H-like HicB family nuclease
MHSRCYRVLIEDDKGSNFSAYAPDLSGCVATGETLADVQREMHDAIAFHLEGLTAAGEPIPDPSDLTAAYVDVAV